MDANLSAPSDGQARRKPGFADWLFSLFPLTLYALVLGLGLGLGSAYHVLRGDYPFGAAQIGPWLAWPELGSSAADPYARAIIAKRGEIPLALGEGLALRATADSAGEPLRASCTYRIGSVTPQTRAWTLSVYDANDALVQSELKRSGFTSAELLRDPAGRFEILLSRDLQPGNWIKLPQDGAVTLRLRLYDMPGVAGAAKLDPSALPSIERIGCGS